MSEFDDPWTTRREKTNQNSQQIIYFFNGIFLRGTFTGLTREVNPGQCLRREVAFGDSVACLSTATGTGGCLTSLSTVTDLLTLRVRSLKRFKIFGTFSAVDLNSLTDV